MGEGNFGFHSVGSRSDLKCGNRVGILVDEAGGRTVGWRRGMSSLILGPRGSVRSGGKGGRIEV